MSRIRSEDGVSCTECIQSTRPARDICEDAVTVVHHPIEQWPGVVHISVQLGLPGTTKLVRPLIVVELVRPIY